MSSSFRAHCLAKLEVIGHYSSSSSGGKDKFSSQEYDF